MAWHLVTTGGPGTANPNYMEFILDAESDINTEPDWYKVSGGCKPTVGSVAYTCVPGGSALAKLWMRASDETWSEI